ncbi:PaaI family thioesterase [Candidatus Neomarinimicrobiota bacterium]
MTDNLKFKIPDIYLSKYLGYKTELVEPGVTRVEFEIQPQHLNMAGVLHGGIYMTIMDSLMGHALYSISGQGLGGFATTAMHTHFMQGVSEGSIIGYGRYLAANDAYMNAEARITDQSGMLLASAEAQFTLIDADQRSDKS